MHRSEALAHAASELVGTPFRLQGRDLAHGLDCIGLVLASLAAVGVRIDLPADYRPRQRSFTIPLEALHAAGLVQTAGARRAGDILLLRTAPAQLHTAIAAGHGDIVHAHAGLGKVVRAPLPDSWPILAAWRLDPAGDTLWPR